MLTALIMAGGSGQRFWPLSREKRPKQLLDLASEKTMIKETVDRILPLISGDKIFIATNIKYSDEIQRQLPMIPPENIIIEPEGKDTAACIGYAALVIEKKFAGAKMAVLASDHLIKQEKKFREILLRAAEEIETGDKIVTLGITPDKPETGYGYIEIQKEKNITEGKTYRVKAFHEKPNLTKAEYFLNEGNYLWNSGMFIWKTTTILKNIEKYMEKHAVIITKMKKKINETDKYGVELAEYIRSEFTQFEKISIDYGVMEKAEEIFVIPVDFGWNDIGSFPALDEVFEKNENESVLKEGKLYEIASKGNIVIGKKDKIVSLIGLNDFIVIDTDDALLICRKDQAQDIKKAVQKIKESGDEKYL